LGRGSHLSTAGVEHIALKVIDFISQFEDELVRIWNKPKFFHGSHYIVTLDRLAAEKGGLDIIAELRKGMNVQIVEWHELGIVERGL